MCALFSDRTARGRGVRAWHRNACAGEVRRIAFHPSGNYLLSVSTDATIKARASPAPAGAPDRRLPQMWDIREGHLLYTMHGHDGAPRTECVCMRVCVCGGGGGIELCGIAGPVNGVAFAPGGEYFTTCGDDAIVRAGGWWWRTRGTKTPARR